MGGLSIWHWLIVLVVVLLLFGTGKVSNLMGEFGKGIKTLNRMWFPRTTRRRPRTLR